MPGATAREGAYRATAARTTGVLETTTKEEMRGEMKRVGAIGWDKRVKERHKNMKMGQKSEGMGQKSEGTRQKYEKGRKDRTTGDTDGRRGERGYRE